MDTEDARLRPISIFGRSWIVRNRNWPKLKLAEVEIGRSGAGPPLRWTPLHRTTLHRTTLRRTTLHRDRPKFRSFSFVSSLRSHFHSSFLGVFLWNFGGVFESRGPQVCSFRVVGVSCEALAAPPDRGTLAHDSPRTPNVHIWGSRRFKNHQNSTRRPPRETWNFLWERKKSAKFWAPHPSGPHPSGPHFSRSQFGALHFVVPKFNIQKLAEIELAEVDCEQGTYSLNLYRFWNDEVLHASQLQHKNEWLWIFELHQVRRHFVQCPSITTWTIRSIALFSFPSTTNGERPMKSRQDYHETPRVSIKDADQKTKNETKQLPRGSGPREARLPYMAFTQLLRGEPNIRFKFHTKASSRIRRRACLWKPRSINSYIWQMVESKVVEQVLVGETKMDIEWQNQKVLLF